jgi:CubicO group peptidase (beta-lactamase class C family)
MEKTTPNYLLMLCFISLVALIPVPVIAQAEKLEGLDDFIISGMADWQIPGLGISVVKDGEIIYEKGFGVRKLGGSEKVDQHTIFGIASTTKAMTATALGMLVDEGKIGWDDRVRDHLPWFELSDRLASDLVTIRDLLSHQVGIGRMTGNRLVFMPNRDRRTILKHIAHQPLDIPFRSGYVYSNVMYMVAGMIIEEVEGISWDEFLPLRLFAPLGMNSASVSITRISENDNAAWPHQEIEGVVRPIPRRNFDNVGPAASVNASAHDMAQWMLLNLGVPGQYEDQTLVSSDVMNEIFQPQHAFRVRDPLRNSFSAYTLGWNSGSYDEYRLFQHSGGTDGMNSIVALVPELDLGIFIAGNLFCGFRPALVSWIIDRQAGIERDHDWNEMFHSRYLKEKEEAIQRKKEIEDARIRGTVPALEPEAYVGIYYNQVYDDVEIKIGKNGILELHFWGDEKMVADLEHWHYDTFRAAWRNPAMGKKFVNFDLGQDGKIRQLNVNFTLRPVMIEVGNYPAGSYRVVEYKKLSE